MASQPLPPTPPLPPPLAEGFLVGHATHPDWRTALALVAAQVDGAAAQRPAGAPEPTLGLVYLTDTFAAHAEPLLEALRERWPGVAWVGGVGVGISAGAAEYWDEPALALMLCPLPADSFEVFSGVRPPDWSRAHTALVHADPAAEDLAELVDEASRRVASGYLFGGVVSSRGEDVHIAEGVWRGGLSGVVFGPQVDLVSRVTQGCQPVGPERLVGQAQANVVVELDGRPALQCLVDDLGIDLGDPRTAVPRLRATLVGLSDGPEDGASRRQRAFGPDVRVRHLVGLDPAREAVAVADRVEPGMRLAFCSRDVEAARRDLVRICSEIRDEVESGGLDAPDPAAPARRALGAVYVSCTGRGGAHFGSPCAELKTVQRALGDVPLVGFFANGEIARRHLYGYTGVLTVFTGPAPGGQN